MWIYRDIIRDIMDKEFWSNCGGDSYGGFGDFENIYVGVVYVYGYSVLGV